MLPYIKSSRECFFLRFVLVISWRQTADELCQQRWRIRLWPWGHPRAVCCPWGRFLWPAGWHVWSNGWAAGAAAARPWPEGLGFHVGTASHLVSKPRSSSLPGGGGPGLGTTSPGQEPPKRGRALLLDGRGGGQAGPLRLAGSPACSGWYVPVPWWSGCLARQGCAWDGGCSRRPCVTAGRAPSPELRGAPQRLIAVSLS